MNQPSQSSSPSIVLHLNVLAVAMLAGYVTLVYQLVVIRFAMIWFGSESETLAAVVCMSLLGLSAGAYVSGRRAAINHQPLQSLATWLAVCAALQVLFWLTCETLAAWVDSSGLSIRQQKLSFAAAATLPVNFFIGATLPLLTSAIATVREKQSFATIYAAETIGAAIGAILTGFYMIPLIGLSITQLSAAALTASAATIAFSFRKSDIGNAQKFDGEATTQQQKQTLGYWFLLTAVLLAGISTMGIEIAWQRFFVLLFGSDTQSFAVVAATYLVGISLGSWLAGRVIRITSQTLSAYATVLACVAAATVMATLVLIELVLEPNALPFATEWFSARPALYRILTAASVMIVPTTLIGLALPLVVASCTPSQRESASAVGKVYAATLIGNVVGLLGTGFLITSGNGLRMTVLLLSCFALVAAAILIFFTIPRKTHHWLGTVVAALALFIWIQASIFLGQSKLPLGVELNEWDLDYYAEGKSNIVAVVTRKTDTSDRRMIIDGVTIGESSGGVGEKQQLLAHLPFLVRKPAQQQNVLTIGLGTGILAGALSSNPEVENVICVELSAEVIEACNHFSDINGDVANDAKVKIQNADGIYFLRKTDQEFDVIVSDAKSRPGHAGNVAFFTRDYYEACSQNLTTKGIFVQWVSLETAFESVQTIIASFESAFRYGYIAVSSPDSIYLVGANAQLVFDEERISEYLQNTNRLLEYGWQSPSDIASLFWLDQRSLQEPSPYLNRYNRPVLEMFALRSSGTSPEAHKLSNLSWLKSLLTEKLAVTRTGETDFLASHRQAAMELIEASILLFQRPDNWLDLAGGHAKSAHSIAPKLNRHQFIADLYRQLAASASSRDDAAKQFNALLSVSEMGLATAAEQFFLGSILLERGESSQALVHLHQASQLEPETSAYQCTFGFALIGAGKIGQAKRVFETTLKQFPENPEGLLGLGICQAKIDPMEDGSKLIQEALRAKPELQDLWRQYIGEPR